MRITFQNFTGGGFASTRDIPSGTTAAQFFRTEMGGGANPGNYRIQVNGLPAVDSQVLTEGDVVYILANQKHEGA